LDFGARREAIPGERSTPAKNAGLASSHVSPFLSFVLFPLLHTATFFLAIEHCAAKPTYSYNQQRLPFFLQDQQETVPMGENIHEFRRSSQWLPQTDRREILASGRKGLDIMYDRQRREYRNSMTRLRLPAPHIHVCHWLECSTVSSHSQWCAWSFGPCCDIYLNPILVLMLDCSGLPA
jgi:hypothetical protein